MIRFEAYRQMRTPDWLIHRSIRYPQLSISYHMTPPVAEAIAEVLAEVVELSEWFLKPIFLLSLPV